MTIYFYSINNSPYSCFSNFSAHGFELNGVYWPTVEHYFQAQKFAGTPYEDQIRDAHSPKKAKELGRSRKLPLRPDWEEVKDDIMRQGVLLKFRTHASIREILLGTEGEELVENAPSDYYWGCGANGTGLNRLGQILMEIRTLLRQS